MTTQKKFSTIIISVVFAVVSLFGALFGGLVFSGCGEPATAKKIVMMIGDGMGPVHVQATAEFYEETLNMQTLTYQGLSETYSLSWAEPDDKGPHTPTDSAAGATALSTGNRVWNDYVAMDKDGNELKTISEIAQEMGYGVGIVVTDSLHGATPAAFSAHDASRKNYAAIRQDQYTSGIDLFLGAGYSDYYAELATIEENGYTFVNDYSALDLEDEKILGAFNSVPALHEEGVDKNLNPTLSELTDFAVEYMEKHFPEGYFLMIEGSHIDKTSDSWPANGNDKLEPMMQYLYDFDQCVGIVKETLAAQKEDYAIVVTADHETGNLGKHYGEEGFEYLDVYGDVYTFTTHRHTNLDVPYFIETTVDCSMEDRVKNTDIFEFMKKSYGA